MVSNASDDLPDPDTPVITVSWFVGNRKRNVFEVVDPRTADPDVVLHWNLHYTIQVKLVSARTGICAKSHWYLTLGNLWKRIGPAAH